MDGIEGIEGSEHDVAVPGATRGARVRHVWHQHLDGGERSAITAWASFTLTFAGVRALTHWIRDGHGPSSGGMSLGGQHFHHYNLGIALLAGVGALAVHGQHDRVQHPLTAASYGVGTALIVDEAALLLDLQDVYWSQQGRTSVDLAVGIIGAGGLAIAGAPLWPRLLRALR